ncbi:glycosyltransferase family 4 protein [bacterium]|jgi:glycosyltransferase involved in cell wall biosynthesis|nr:glycosyltransferase family 4 protein [bacterium]
MKIGIYFTTSKLQGGVHQYSLAILEAIDKIKGNDYVIFDITGDTPRKYHSQDNFKIIPLNTSTKNIIFRIKNVTSNLVSRALLGLFSNLYKTKWQWIINLPYKTAHASKISIIDNENLDIVIYPTSSNLSFLTKTKSIVAIHDLAHKTHPDFKEVSANGKWEAREYSYSKIAKKTKKILVSSNLNRQDVIKYYQAKPEQVVILPYLPPSYLSLNIPKITQKKILEKYKINKPFVYYPAKFWPHKNHLNLIKAIHKLRKDNFNIQLILTGSKNAEYSTYPKVVKYIDKHNLSKQIKYLGYVDAKEISALYKQAEALVMPTFFGTTNIPTLEAWKMETPIITSNIRGCRDQLGDAGLLVNPRMVDSIAEKIKEVVGNAKLKKDLAHKGKKRLAHWTENDFSQTIKNMITEIIK